MNRSIHLFIFGFLGLLVFLNSGASAVCFPSSTCDCEPENIKDCDTSIPDFKRTTRACGSEFGCALTDHIYQINENGDFCHFGPCTNGCTATDPDAFCN